MVFLLSNTGFSFIFSDDGRCDELTDKKTPDSPWSRDFRRPYDNGNGSSKCRRGYATMSFITRVRNRRNSERHRIRRHVTSGSGADENKLDYIFISKWIPVKRYSSEKEKKVLEIP